MLSLAQGPPKAVTDQFEELFAKFYPELVRLTQRVVADRLDGEDVAQEAFLRLADDAILLRPDAEVGAWLRRVCLNLSFNRVRDRRHAAARLERVGRLESAGVVGEPDPAADAERSEQRASVRRALAALPERQRDCLLLRHSGFSYAEVAETLGVAVGSVGVILARAERAFRDIYKERNHDLS